MKRTSAKVVLHIIGGVLIAVGGWRFVIHEGGFGMWDIVGIGIFVVLGSMLAFPYVVERTLSSTAPYLPFIDDPEEDADEDC